MLLLNIGIIIAGNVINDDANITGITPAITNLIGICVFCPPYIFLPTTFFAYCTGTLLSASVTNTTPATINIAPIIIPNTINSPVVEKPAEVNINLYNDTTPLGNPAIIPIKIIIEIPFPTPFAVICSPNHISSAVPATNDKTTKNPVIKVVSTNIPDDL